jgi:hypothetical protein
MIETTLGGAYIGGSSEVEMESHRYLIIYKYPKNSKGKCNCKIIIAYFTTNDDKVFLNCAMLSYLKF